MDVMAKRRCAFVGAEAEGPLQNITTLFVPRSEQRSIAVLVEKALPEAVYYGAGNDRGMTVQQAHDLIAYRNQHRILPFTVLVEMTLVDIAASRVYVLLKANRIPFRCVLVDTEGCVALKWLRQTDLVWHERGESYNTRLDDPRYTQDNDI